VSGLQKTFKRLKNTSEEDLQPPLRVVLVLLVLSYMVAAKIRQVMHLELKI
jgi:hypothetical protein